MPETIEVLLRRAIDSPTAEPAFFRALLDAELFVHRPQGDDVDRLRIVQFDRPDGLQVIPVFTDLLKAQAASGAGVEIVGLKGRVLFEATRGATLMLNPNDTSCTLYPEEIADLLNGRCIAHAPVAANAAGVAVEKPQDRDLWIGRLVAEALKAVEPATVLYQLQVHTDQNAGPASTVLAVGVPRHHAERAARAASACLQAHAHRLPGAVDLTVFDPSEPMPDWLTASGSAPMWRRDPIH